MSTSKRKQSESVMIGNKYRIKRFDGQFGFIRHALIDSIRIVFESPDRDYLMADRIGRHYFVEGVATHADID